MNAEQGTSFWDRLRAIYEAEDGNLEAFDTELPVLRKVLSGIDQDLQSANISIGQPLGRGGAGIVVKVREDDLKRDGALKIPRPRQDDLIDSVRNEVDHLTSLHHDNLIHVHRLGAVPIEGFVLPYPYFVMDFVPSVMNLRAKVTDLISSMRRPADLATITKWLSRVLSPISSVLQYLHSEHTIHFDVKPANILIDSTDKPILSDLGFAKRKVDESVPAIVGFTLMYAHPDLRMQYQHMSSQNRVRKKLSPTEFRYEWDLYAFGKTILEILSLIDQHFVDLVSYDYHFIYMHLAACRMLDGHNLSDEDILRIRQKQVQDKVPSSAYRETWLNLSPADFSSIAFRSASDVYGALEALVHGRRLKEALPELDDGHTDRVQISHQGSAPFSDRVKALVNHPCFSRLQSVLQLGFANAVYPGATHTRFEHSIGVYRNACDFIRNLLNDNHNPLFYQLTTDVDLKALVVASLLHDLGQFPLAHDLEEATNEINHERITLKWLENPTTDTAGHTLKELIENEDYGWGIPIGKVKSILNEAGRESSSLLSESLINSMLASVIDGPIDVDKLDYLVRDSDRACLPYGQLIDRDRLLRNLTVIVARDEMRRTNLTLGTYEKGQSAAESATFARYLLYQALYWHHAVRAARVMLREAVRTAVPVKGIGGKPRRSFVEGLEEFLGVSTIPRILTNVDILGYVESTTDEHGRKLVSMIRKRHYYKRVLTIHSDVSEEEGRKTLLDRFREAGGRETFNSDLQMRLRTKLDLHMTNGIGLEASSLAPVRKSTVLEMLGGPNMILCDCPKAPYGGREKLRFIPEPRRMLRNYMSRVSAGDRVSEVWQQVFFKLMEIASKARVYCHPAIRDTLMSALGPDGIRQALAETIGAR
jgi:HD superfamily phosphohydrolase